MKLDGKRCVITGGSRGLGRAMCLAFAREGAKIAFNYSTDDADAQTTEAALVDLGCEPLVFKGSVANSKHVTEMIKSITASWRGPIQRIRAATLSVDATSRVQKAQYVAASGILLRQCGHSTVFGPTGSSDLKRSISLFTGSTTKKYTTAARMMNDNSALMNSPIAKRLPLTVKASSEKSGTPPNAPINGVIRLSTNALTTAPNAAPIEVKIDPQLVKAAETKNVSENKLLSATRTVLRPAKPLIEPLSPPFLRLLSSLARLSQRTHQ
jgi:hypothetical protein